MPLPDPRPPAAARLAGFVPFSPQRVAHYRAAGYWPGRWVDSLLREAAVNWPERIAVADAADPHTAHTYADLDRRADRAAVGFAGLGIAPGERVLLQLPNSCRFAVALFGLLRAGAIPVLCLPGHRLAELTHFADRSGAVGVVIGDDAEQHRMARQLVTARPRLRHLIIAGGNGVEGVEGGEGGDPGAFVSLADLPAGTAPVGAIDTATPALLLTSGGTTGLPKLIPRTHDDYVYNATASAALCRLTGDDVYLAVLPAAHNFPLACPGLLGAITVGATTVFTTDPSSEAAFATIARHGVTVTAVVPALAKLWAQACDWEPEKPTSLRLLQVGGAKLASEDARRIRVNLTPGLQQVFGMAEGLLNFTRLDDPVEVVEQTQGRPLCAADELRVV
ncbi:MAG TPA: AMP-binding protein, partial [Mycobacterium sp.]|nr:AMP-binding protein [Mycobacterium sp.]